MMTKAKEPIPCREMTEEDIRRVIPLYLRQYNDFEGDSWTPEIVYRRIHQVWSREDSLCLIMEQEGEPLGFAMGYLEAFYDLDAYYLAEIVIDHARQGEGLGTRLMAELETAVKARGGRMIQLASVNDEMHRHFYGKLGFLDANSLVLKSKFLSDESDRNEAET